MYKQDIMENFDPTDENYGQFLETAKAKILSTRIRIARASKTATSRRRNSLGTTPELFFFHENMDFKS
jgi:hypothetical protein